MSSGITHVCDNGAYLDHAYQVGLRQASVRDHRPPGWKYFHITPDDMGPVFTFTLRVPTWSGETEAEDFTTPRVSLARSVHLAVRGKFGSEDPNYFSHPEMHVYAAKSLSQMYVPRTGTELSTSDNPWGPDWSYARYAEAHGLDPDDELQRAKLVKGRVSDDPTHTGEVWSLAPVKMSLVGRLWPNDKRSPNRLLQKNLLRTRELENEGN